MSPTAAALLPLALAVSLISGCASTTETTSDAGDRSAPPADLALELLVESNRYARPTEAPALYILEPNRALHVAIGPGAAGEGRPPTTALLTHRQRREVWDLLSSLIDPTGSSEADAPKNWRAEPPADDVTYQLHIAAHGRTRQITLGVGADGASRALAAALTQRLAELGGVTPAMLQRMQRRDPNAIARPASPDTHEPAPRRLGQPADAPDGE